MREQTSTVLTQIGGLIGLAAQAPEALRTLVALTEATQRAARQLAADVQHRGRAGRAA